MTPELSRRFAKAFNTDFFHAAVSLEIRSVIADYVDQAQSSEDIPPQYMDLLRLAELELSTKSSQQ